MIKLAEIYIESLVMAISSVDKKIVDLPNKPKIKMFVWNETFETGIDIVDKQHKHLVDLINNIAEHINLSTLDFKDMNFFLQEVIDYTIYHFNDEEKLMKKVKINKDFFSNHKKNHNTFIYTVKELASSINEENMLMNAKALLDFLINWLAFHILGQDKIFGAQYHMIKDGLTPDEAYEKLMKDIDNKTEPLVHSLTTLFSILTDRNQELTELKNNLEEKVKEKTKELVDKNIKLEYLSQTDQLTELKNRRFGMEVIKKLYEEINDNNPLSVIMIDADNFKCVNDEFGHNIGDKVLIALSKTLKDNIRTNDIVCRLGGDEFLIICPYTNKSGALTLAKHLLSIIKNMKIMVGTRNSKKVYWQSSASLGVASSEDNIKSFQDLIKIADIKMYEAKNNGKNCVR
ncbi:GGDEF domain-containing protein [Campylobacter sputorum]|uniref:GGDEF domain-containing protein n=1 Tax=Campylobacter sputorum TaxID=206 RepID=UPI001E468456|nr:bacteriohemerythrin [Campylobacter sputorum]